MGATSPQHPFAPLSLLLPLWGVTLICMMMYAYVNTNMHILCVHDCIQTTVGFKIESMELVVCFLVLTWAYVHVYILAQAGVCTCMCMHMARYYRGNCPKEGRHCSGWLSLAVFVCCLVGPNTPNQSWCGSTRLLHEHQIKMQPFLPNLLFYFRISLRIFAHDIVVTRLRLEEYILCCFGGACFVFSSMKTWKHCYVQREGLPWVMLGLYQGKHSLKWHFLPSPHPA